MAKTLDDLIKIKGVAAYGAWKPTGRNKKMEILGARGDISEESGYMASAFCEFDLFTSTTQCAIYEEYSKQMKFFPPIAAAIRGKEYSVLTVYAKNGDHMIGCFMKNSDRPDLWDLADEMQEVDQF